MTKKILFILMVGMLMLSACSTGTTTATPTDVATEAVTETETVAEEPSGGNEIVSGLNIVPGETMPCSTINNLEVPADYVGYQAVVEQLPEVSEDDWVKGNADAPVTIIEYADFQCPACSAYSSYLLAYQALYPDTFRLVYRHMPLPSIHHLAYISSMAAEAAGAQGKFWEMYELLFSQQSVWSGYASEEEFTVWVLGQAETLGLDLDQFEADMTDADARASLETQTDEQLALGIHYTPFIIINGTIMSSFSVLTQYISVYNYDGYDTCPSWVVSPDKTYTAKLDTTVGDIYIDLNLAAAPLAVNNFVFLAQQGWFDDVPFHRVLEGFVAQTGELSGFGPGYSFVNETNNDLSYDGPGVVGMANAGADTNGSQFFITLAATTSLDGSYTIFGKVQEDSLALLNEIALRDPDTAVDFEDATFINSIEIIEN
ncbi:MAG: peptidylprolyl isomerase [Anaerolineaceae bacterium]|nr:peptidylprolyl isomerase [Anaerolineaceae bacterium]